MIWYLRLKFLIAENRNHAPNIPKKLLIFMTIYIACPEVEDPCGGIKILYHHVDVLNENGFPAYILHKKDGFRCDWFQNNTPICYIHSLRINKDKDYLVLPEVFGPQANPIGDISKGVRKIIFNQGAHLTFRKHEINKNTFTTPYLHEEVVACLVVSEHSENYLRYIFPNLSIYRIVNSIDQDLFSYDSSIKKKPKIAFMTRRRPEAIKQVINILKFRRVLQNFELMLIENMSHIKVSQILKSASVFLSFCRQEGCPLPPAEAMSCGCIVIGYHGIGGKEYFKEEFCYPVPEEDIIAFAKTAETVLKELMVNPRKFDEKRKQAAQYIKDNYSKEKEKNSIINAWKEIMRNTA